MAAQILSAAHLVLHEGDSLLMIRRFNTGWEDGNYSLVAGHIEPGEPARDAMAREAKEEAGIAIAPDDLQFVHIMHRYKTDGLARLDLFFQCTKWQGEVHNAEPHKCDDMTWRHPDNLPTNTIPYIHKALTRIRNGHHFSEHGWPS